MKIDKKTGLPIVETLEDLEEAKKEGYIYVRAKCCKCGSLWTSVLPNAYHVITKGCVICTMDTEDEWSPAVVAIRGGD